MSVEGWGESAPKTESGKFFSSRVNFASVGPILVSVSGKQGENLGVGNLIGIIHRGGRKNARVISIRDPESPDGVTELLNTECDYVPITREQAMEMADAQGSELPMTPTAYLTSLVETVPENLTS